MSAGGDTKTHIFLEYSSICNANPLCLHCQGAPFKYDSTLKRQQFERVLEMARAKGLPIALTGGDPSAYPGVVRRLEQSGVKYSIATNGLARIPDVHPSDVYLSLDADDLRPYDQSGVLENAISYGARLSVTTCISRALDIWGLYERLLSHQENIYRWRLSFLNVSGNARNNIDTIKPDYDVAFPALARVITHYLDNKPFQLNIKGFWWDDFEVLKPAGEIGRLNNPCVGCAGQSAVSIDGMGNVTYCPLSQHKVGNVDEGVSAFDASFRDERYSSTYSRWSDCMSCRYLHLCGGGCPAKAEERAGDWYARDPHFCEIMHYWEKYILPILPSGLRERLADQLVDGGDDYAAAIH